MLLPKSACVLAQSRCMFRIISAFQDDLQMDEFPLGEDMHHLPGKKLFDFMAEKLVKFAERIGKR